METLWILYFALTLNGEVDWNTVKPQEDRLYKDAAECMVDAQKDADAALADEYFMSLIKQSKYGQLVVGCSPYDPPNSKSALL